MVLKPEPLFGAIESLRSPGCTVIYLSPDGEPLSPTLARGLSTLGHLILVSGHYEGIDQRVRDELVDQEISIGDYVLTNGTLSAAVLIDCVCRHVPGVLGEEKSLTQDSFAGSLLSFPQYTRPAEYRGLRVPGGSALGQPRIDRKVATVARERKRPASNAPDLLIRQGTEKP